MSAHAACSCTPAHVDPSSVMSGRMPPAAAIATVFSSAAPWKQRATPHALHNACHTRTVVRAAAQRLQPRRVCRIFSYAIVCMDLSTYGTHTAVGAPLQAKFMSARAACSSTPGHADPSSATSGRMPPPDEIAILFSSAAAALEASQKTRGIHKNSTSTAAQSARTGPSGAPLRHAKFTSACAAASCTSATGDSSSATRGRIPPAAAIVELFTSAPPREVALTAGDHTRAAARTAAPLVPEHAPSKAKPASACAAASCTPADADPSSAISGWMPPAAAIATRFSAAPRSPFTPRSHRQNKNRRSAPRQLRAGGGLIVSRTRSCQIAERRSGGVHCRSEPF